MLRSSTPPPDAVRSFPETYEAFAGLAALKAYGFARYSEFIPARAALEGPACKKLLRTLLIDECRVHANFRFCMPEMKRSSLRIRLSTSQDDMFSIFDLTDALAEPETSLLTTPSWEKTWAMLRNLDVAKPSPCKRIRLDGDANKPTYLLIIPSWTLDFEFNLAANPALTTDVRVYVGYKLPHAIRVNPSEHVVFVHWGEHDAVDLRVQTEAAVKAYESLYSDIQPLPTSWDVDRWLGTNLHVTAVGKRYQKNSKGLKSVRACLSKFSERVAGRERNSPAYAEQLLARAVPLLIFDRVMLDMYGDHWHTILRDFRKKSIEAAVRHLRETYRQSPTDYGSSIKAECCRRWHASCACVYANEMNTLLSSRHPRLFRDLSGGDGCLFWTDDEMGMEDLLTISLATNPVICGLHDAKTLEDFRADDIPMPRDRSPDDAVRIVRDLAYSMWGTLA
jgi:hypothetical protein